MSSLHTSPYNRNPISSSVSTSVACSLASWVFSPVQVVEGGQPTWFTYFTFLAPVLWKRKIMHHQQVISNIYITHHVIECRGFKMVDLNAKKYLLHMLLESKSLNRIVITADGRFWVLT